MATKQTVHIVVEDSKAKLQDGFDTIIKEAVDNIHSALYWQYTDEESQEPWQRHWREERQVRHVFGQLG